LIKTKTALEAGAQPGIGYAKTLGNSLAGEVPGAKQTKNRQQHPQMSNMPY
jgi:hypothetical protein